MFRWTRSPASWARAGTRSTRCCTTPGARCERACVPRATNARPGREQSHEHGTGPRRPVAGRDGRRGVRRRVRRPSPVRRRGALRRGPSPGATRGGGPPAQLPRLPRGLPRPARRRRPVRRRRADSPLSPLQPRSSHMWVRIDELSFPADRADDVVDHVRNHAVSSHNGAGFLGFRLLVDREHGSALDVSYWTDLAGAHEDAPGPVATPGEGVETTVVRSNVYELSIDAA